MKLKYLDGVQRVPEFTKPRRPLTHNSVPGTLLSIGDLHIMQMISPTSGYCFACEAKMVLGSTECVALEQGTKTERLDGEPVV